MKFAHLFTREEPVAGLEIQESFLRLALLEHNKKDKNKPKIKVLIEQPLPSGIIVDGAVENPTELAKSLQFLLKKVRTTIRYAIISIPAYQVYSRIFSFPPTVNKEKLEETMELAASFQLPMSREQIYLDWEAAEEPEHNGVFLASAKKEIIDGYIAALNKAGINSVAIEFHPMSVARMIEVKDKEAVLVVDCTPVGSTVYIIQNKIVRFSRVIPYSNVPLKNLKEEIRKIVNYYEAETGTTARVVDSNEIEIRRDWNALLKEYDPKWLASLGAAWRGVLPRDEDTLVSIMPIGTEEAYEYQKATTFVKFLAAVTIILSLFFAVIFIGVWSWLSSLQKNAVNTVGTSSVSSLPPHAVELETRAKQLNAISLATANIIKKSPRWSKALEELKKSIPSDIVINHLAMPAQDGTINLKGVAKNRNQLNIFKKTLEESKLFSDVKLPLTNLEQKESIPFIMTFSLKDQSMLFEAP